MAIAEFAVGRFHEALYTVSPFSNGYEWDVECVYQEQTIAAGGIQNGKGSNGLDLLNNIVRKTGWIGRAAKATAIHYIPSFQFFDNMKDASGVDQG